MAICTCPVSGERFDSPLWIQIRDTVIAKAETNLVVVEGRTVLMEVPQRLAGLTVVNSGITLTEIRDQYQELGDKEYRVDYTIGWIYFNSTYYPDGSDISSISYTGRGIILYPTERLIDTDGNFLSDGISEVYDDGVLVSTGIKGFDFRQNIEVEIDPTDSHRVIINVDPGGGFGGNFIDLSDAPSTYVGQSLKVVAVNAGETAVEFIDIADIVIEPRDSEQTFDSSINSIFGAVEAIDGSPQFNRLYGLSLNQEVVDGDLITSLTSDDNDTTIGLNADGTWSFTGTVFNASEQVFNFDTSDTWVGIVKLSNNSIGDIKDRISIRYSDNSSSSHGTLATGFEYVIAVFNPTKSLQGNMILKEGGAGLIEKEYQMLINITNTPIASKSASEITAIVQEYIEGYTPISNFELQSIGLNLFDGELELGTINVSTGEEVASTTNIRNVNFTPIKGDTRYSNTAGKTTDWFIFYDINQEFISSASSLSANTPVNARYLRFYYLETDLQDEFDVIEGSTAPTVHTVHSSPEDNFKLIADMLSVGTSVRDEAYPLNGAWWKDKYVGRDYNDAVQSTTSWSIGGALTNTHYFYKDLSSLLDYADGVAGTAGNIVIKIGDITFKTVSQTDLTADDEENLIALWGSGGLLVMRVNKTTYATSGDFETYLQANDVEFVYELDEIVTTEIEKNGSLIQESNTTLVQLNNFATEYDITFATNQVAQIGINADNITYIFGEIDDLETELTALTATVAALDVRVVANFDQIALNVLELVDHEARITAIETDIETPLSDESIPYAGLAGKYAESKDALSIAIHGLNVLPINDYKGGTLNQQNLLGKVESSLSYTSYISQTLLGALATNTSYKTTNLTYKTISGHKYFLRIKMKDTSINVIRNEIVFWYSDATTNVASDSVLSSDELTVYGTITATKSLLANLSTRAGAAGTQLDSLSWEIIDYTDTFLDGLTASQINDRIEYFESLQSVGSPVDLDQLRDNRNEFGNSILTEFVVENFDDIPYMLFTADGSNVESKMATTLEDDTLYTIISHTPENSLSNSYVTVVGSGYDTSNVLIGGGETGIDKQLFTTGTITINQHYSYVQSSATVGGKFKTKHIIIKGDHTNITDEQALEWIQNEEFGIFTVKGINIESIGKNKHNYIGDYILADNVIEYVDNGIRVKNTSAGTFDSVTSEQIPLLPNTDYVLSATINIISGVDSGRIRITKPDGSAWTTLDATGEVTFNSGDEEYATFLMYSSLGTSAIQEKEYLNVQLELGTVATDYAEFIKANAHINEELRGLGGVSDDFDFIRFDEDLTVLEAQTYTLSGTTGLTYQRFFLANLDDLLPNLKLPIASGIPLGIIKIGDVTYNPIDLNSVSSQANIDLNPFTYALVDTGTIYIISDEADATAFNANILSVGAEFIHELATPLPRDGILAPLLDMTGKLLVSTDATFTHTSTSGITNYFTTTVPLNLYGQLLLNILTDLSQQKEINKNKTDISDMLDTLNDVKDDTDNNTAAIVALQRTSLLAAQVQVSSNTTAPAANVILSQTSADFDNLDIVIGDSTNLHIVLTVPANFTGDIVLSSDVLISTSVDSVAKFKLNKSTGTDLIAYYGRSITYGAAYSNIASTSIYIKAIYGWNN